jgi:hypothetical protein
MNNRELTNLGINSTDLKQKLNKLKSLYSDLNCHIQHCYIKNYNEELLELLEYYLKYIDELEDIAMHN